MTGREAEEAPSWSAAFGVLPALVLSVFVYVPLTLFVQNALSVPTPNPTPRALRNEPVEIATSYWLTWAISLLVLIVPGVILAPFHRTRRIGIGYLITAIICGGLAATFVILFEIGGTAPD